MTRALEALVAVMVTTVLCGIAFQAGLTWCKQSPTAASAKLVSEHHR